MARYNERKYYEKLPCKFDPTNPGLGCCQPRMCKSCGWNPDVAKRRMEKLLPKKEAPV